LAGTSELTEN
jgi:hypothetical protein